MREAREQTSKAKGYEAVAELREQQPVVETARVARFLPLFAEVWIFATVVVFLLVRILGSSAAKQLLRHFTGR